MGSCGPCMKPGLDPAPAPDVVGASKDEGPRTFRGPAVSPGESHAVEPCIHAPSRGHRGASAQGQGQQMSRWVQTPCDLQPPAASQSPALGSPQDTCWVLLVSSGRKREEPQLWALAFQFWASSGILSCSANVGKEGLQWTGVRVGTQGRGRHLSRIMNFWDRGHVASRGFINAF